MIENCCLEGWKRRDAPMLVERNTKKNEWSFCLELGCPFLPQRNAPFFPPNPSSLQSLSTSYPKDSINENLLCLSFPKSSCNKERQIKIE